MEIDTPDPTETDMLKNKEGQPEVKYVHYDNSIKSKIHGFMLFFCKYDNIEKSCEPQTLYGATHQKGEEPAFVVVFCVSVIVMFVCVFDIIGYAYNTCFPHNKSYDHSEVEFFVNSTKYKINPQYDSCYVANDVKHCHVYEEVGLFFVGFVVVFVYLLALLTTFCGSAITYAEGHHKLAIFSAISSATIMVLFIYFAKTQLFDDIQFYGSFPPPAFKHIVHNCEKISAIEIECKYRDDMVTNAGIFLFSLVGMLFISMSIAGICDFFGKKWNEYMEFRESVKKSVQEETVNLV